MSRFFKLPESRIVDVGYNLPKEVMNELYYKRKKKEDSDNELDILDDSLLKVQGKLSADKQYVDQWRNNIYGKIDQLVESNPDPENLQKQVHKIRKQVVQDMTTGNIATVLNNNANVDSVLKQKSELKKYNQNYHENIGGLYDLKVADAQTLDQAMSQDGKLRSFSSNRVHGDVDEATELKATFGEIENSFREWRENNPSGTFEQFSKSGGVGYDRIYNDAYNLKNVVGGDFQDRLNFDTQQLEANGQLENTAAQYIALRNNFYNKDGSLNLEKGKQQLTKSISNLTPEQQVETLREYSKAKVLGDRASHYMRNIGAGSQIFDPEKELARKQKEQKWSTGTRKLPTMENQAAQKKWKFLKLSDNEITQTGAPNTFMFGSSDSPYRVLENKGKDKLPDGVRENIDKLFPELAVMTAVDDNDPNSTLEKRWKDKDVIRILTNAFEKSAGEFLITYPLLGENGRETLNKEMLGSAAQTMNGTARNFFVFDGMSGNDQVGNLESAAKDAGYKTDAAGLKAFTDAVESAQITEINPIGPIPGGYGMSIPTPDNKGFRNIIVTPTTEEEKNIFSTSNAIIKQALTLEPGEVTTPSGVYKVKPDLDTKEEIFNFSVEDDEGNIISIKDIMARERAVWHKYMTESR